MVGLHPVLSQNAEELGKNWVCISSWLLQKNYIDKTGKKASVPALVFSPQRWNRFRSSAFLLLHLHLKGVDLCPFYPGSCHLLCHIGTYLYTRHLCIQPNCSPAPLPDSRGRGHVGQGVLISVTAVRREQICFAQPCSATFCCQAQTP